MINNTRGYNVIIDKALENLLYLKDEQILGH
ncbi:MAG: hypothetical protein RIQ61_223 [Bacteroidota bacterium]|jgi:hypothetical protein